MTLTQVVMDTNVLLSGLRSRAGSAFVFLQNIGRGYFDINLSVPLVLEYKDVLLRQLPFLPPLTPADIDTLLDYYCSVANLHEIYYLWRPILRDPKDEMILELAVKAQCDFIVTFNKRDFLGIEQFGVVALTPKEFLGHIGVWSL